MTSRPHDPSGHLLLKGLEEEVYTGDTTGHVIGMSHEIAADLPGFATEPDSRNVEYITAPYRDYQILIDRLMAKRCALRRYLSDKGGFTLVPGSVIPLDPAENFQISNEANPYYRHIRDTYGTRVVTASTHINIGIDEPEELLRVYRAMRMEASLFLALTAASPFRDGKVTGAHSTRWQMFPETPDHVPLFASHQQFIDWMPTQLESGAMYNSRHLWISIRPNGEETPRDLNRLELRICDRISTPKILRGVIALYEIRVQQALHNRGAEPLDGRFSEDELLQIVRDNEAAAAADSLDAVTTDWRTGDKVPMKEWILALVDEAKELTSELGMDEELDPIRERLETGNLSQRWLAQVEAGATPAEVIQQAIEDLTEIDQIYDPDCPSP
ncbi:MAG: glutamate--cysteine ligase [Acidobacteriota bacterium]